jgi:hypothetical protein
VVYDPQQSLADNNMRPLRDAFGDKNKDLPEKLIPERSLFSLKAA